MSKVKSMKYQDEKIRYHTKLLGYYEDLKSGAIVSRLTNDEIDDQMTYHAQLLVYHQKRRALILKHRV